jgi:cyclic pyranopterin phosphate synthase
MGIKMIDISKKDLTERTAIASIKVMASGSLMKKIKRGNLPKGDCWAAAQLAAILAAKNTPQILPLCHPVRITHADIRFRFQARGLEIIAEVRAHDATGVEMEALAACAVAALTVYDMAKTESRDIVITDLKLLKKTGGKSGDYSAR